MTMKRNGIGLTAFKRNGVNITRMKRNGVEFFAPIIPPPPPGDNFAALAAMSGSFVIEFTADGTAGILANQAIFEMSPSTGTLIRHSPAAMFTDPSIYWLERIRVQGDNSSPTFFAAVDINRGGSSVSSMEQAPYQTGSGFAIYVINEDTDQYLVYDATLPRSAGSGFINFRVSTSDTDEQNAARILAHNLGDNPPISVYAGFMNQLPGNRVVIGVAPSGYTPTFI